MKSWIVYLAILSAVALFQQRKIEWLRNELTATKFDCAIMDYQSAKEHDQIGNSQGTPAMTFVAFQNREGEIIPDEIIFSPHGMVLPEGLKLQVQTGSFDSDSGKNMFHILTEVYSGQRYRIVLERRNVSLFE